MTKSAFLIPLAALLAGAPPALAAPAEAAAPASIPFVHHGGIRSWTSRGDQTVYFQDAHRNWYKATLFSSAPSLPFAFNLRVDTGPMGTLDKWSAVYIDNERYPFSSFERVSGPPRKADGAKQTQES